MEVLKFILTRQRVGKDFIKGVLTIPDTSFSCLTLEAKDITGHAPVNPTFGYALSCGVYPIKLRANNGFPFCPSIVAPPYKNLSFVTGTEGEVRAGCIGVGAKFFGTKVLMGYTEVMEGFNRLVRTAGLEKFNGTTITIVESSNMHYDEDDPSENELEDETYNFADL